MNAFDKGIALETAGDRLLRGRTVPEWANMVGPFGGMTAANIVRAVELQPDVLGSPVALTVNYLAPIADGSFEIRVRAVRTNRSNQHWTVELSQDHEVKATATAVFGVRRDTWSDTELVPPAASAPEDVPGGASLLDIAWWRNYDARFVEGAPPSPEVGESAASTTTLWVRDNPPRPLDYPALTAISDIFYPRVFLRRGGFVPAGTISFTVYFHADDAQLAEQGIDHVLATARAQRFSAGHFDQAAQIWGRRGTLLATTHQMVYFKG